jgi:dTDP-4-dehydrorhamnose reductase
VTNAVRPTLLLGAQGQLGVELRKTFAGPELIAVGREQCDLANPAQLRETIARLRPGIILNAAAYTAVDRAESEPEQAMAINGEAPGLIAEEARKAGALLVHYSTDYVFDGTKAGAWTEGDDPHPLNVYGATKLEGERRIAQAGGRYLILRTSWVFSPQGNNFLRTMLRLGAERNELKIVNDQRGAPTSARAIAEATLAAVRSIDTQAKRGGDYPAGIFHMSCVGETTWSGFAEAIFRHAAAPEGKPWARVKGICSEEYPTPARRPKNSVLSNALLKEKFRVVLPDWEAALVETLRDFGEGRLNTRPRAEA